MTLAKPVHYYDEGLAFLYEEYATWIYNSPFSLPRFFYLFDPPPSAGDWYYPSPDKALAAHGRLTPISTSKPTLGTWVPNWTPITPWRDAALSSGASHNLLYHTAGQIAVGSSGGVRAGVAGGKTLIHSGFSAYEIEEGQPVKVYSTTGRPLGMVIFGPPSMWHAYYGPPPNIRIGGGAFVTRFGFPSPPSTPSNTVEMVVYRNVRKYNPANIPNWDVETTEVARVTVPFSHRIGSGPFYTFVYTLPFQNVSSGSAFSNDVAGFRYYSEVEIGSGNGDPGGAASDIWHKVPCSFLGAMVCNSTWGGEGTWPGWMREMPP